MGRPWVELSEEEKERVDDFVAQQCGLKNLALLNDVRDVGIGILLVDRCVPDAVTFTPADAWDAKAKGLLEAISPGRAKRQVHRGHVILLLGEPPELVIRARCSGKESGLDYVTGLQEETKKVYPGTGVTHLDARGMSIAEVVRSVAEIIHLKEYAECDIHALLTQIRDRGYPGVEYD